MSSRSKRAVWISWISGWGGGGEMGRHAEFYAASPSPLLPYIQRLIELNEAIERTSISFLPLPLTLPFLLCTFPLKSIRLLVRVYASAKVSWMKGYIYVFPSWSPPCHVGICGYNCFGEFGHYCTVLYCILNVLRVFTQAETSLIQTRNSTEWIFAQALVYVSRFFLWHISYTCKLGTWVSVALCCSIRPWGAVLRSNMG